MSEVIVNSKKVASGWVADVIIVGFVLFIFGLGVVVGMGLK